MSLALWACAILLVFEKFTRAYLFQIALEIIWLPIQTAQVCLIFQDLCIVFADWPIWRASSEKCQ